MLHETVAPHAAPPPGKPWHRHPVLFPWYNALISVVLIVLVVTLGWHILRWAVIDAITLPATPADCRAGHGACWAFIEDKAALLFFGLYPRDNLWRPLLAILLPLAFIGLRPLLPVGRLIGPLAWGLIAGADWLLLHGGVAGLAAVPSDQWGGFTLTLVLAVGSTLLALPVGVLLALARTSKVRALHLLATGYIELMRSVPLLAMLFAAAVVVPLLLPPQTDVPKVLRALIGIALCLSAYIAEALRSGLSTLPKGQFEAAHAIGLGYWKTQGLIILPQAFKAALPALTTTFLDFFKGTSLVLIIGVFDLMGASRAALADAQWQAFFLELYLAVGAIYFFMSFAISAGSARLERRLNTGANR